MNIITVKCPVNDWDKLIKVSDFDALEGWDLQRRYIEFAQTKDSAMRKEFTMEILRHAAVVLDETEIPLTTAALINNHLGNWMNVKEVFEGVLKHNGIDPETHAEKLGYWADAGAELAVNFIAQIPQLIIPLMAQLEADKEQSKG